jgi:tellurite methyltransferase
VPWYHDEPFNAFWERSYRDLGVSSMGGPSFEVAEVAPLLPANARVLDLGCGEGRNSLFLASLGHSVVAIDHSDAGIGKLRAIAERTGVALEAHVGDIAALEPAEDFDCVLAHGVLYYLENPVWRQLLARLKQRTRPGGFHVFTVFIYNADYPVTDEIAAAHYKSSFRPRELAEVYRDWRELRFDQYVKWDSHPGIPIHYHPIEKLVAQKPGGEVAYAIEPIASRAELTAEQFRAIDMGITQDELVARAGRPDVVDRMDANGVQYGMSLQIDDAATPAPATVDGYTLELWFYGKHVVYVTNGVVSGRSLFTTPPVRIVHRR